MKKISGRRIADTLKNPLASEIFLIDHFISHEECDHMLEELRFAKWRPSLTYMLQQDGTRRDVLSSYRVSKTARSPELTTGSTHEPGNGELKFWAIRDTRDKSPPGFRRICPAFILLAFPSGFPG